MPFCPGCRYEYLEGVAECPDCRMPLVAQLPDEEIHASRIEPELVALPSLPGLVYAEMVGEALKNAGIPCLIKSDVLTSGYQARGAGGTGGDCTIWVRKKDVVEARSILHSMMDHI